MSAESAEAETKQPDRHISTGRNLPAAIGIGVLLGGLALLTLLTVKATFLIYMGVALALALHELAAAFRTKDIHVQLAPVALGGAAMLTAGYWAAGGAVAAAFALTLLGVLIFRMFLGADGYVRDVSAAVFATAYLGLLGACVSAMLAPHDGGKRVLTFIILTICSDIGGYFAGITLKPLTGGHKMAPIISPKKTWEGLAGSAVLSIVAGAILLPALLHGHWWQGIITGAAAVAAAVFGDLAESMIKRDLGIKDMGSLLPGHGGVLDRIDSLLFCAPVVWLLLALFIK
ncbi:phosphatidate cytidylyltransferase [Trebonia kvetii]|uniref:Phosphatidate cytidylyltransferase n=1 Tax=Trebonia kvetii TaxID=2480626 RepID=A0A6P2C9Q3_9ACTN|nr:phosphatidate cytidylyltransferase [Trebonia kvetii]TVZ06293.1 phosphatidate cytidylyltransferase [Trebonia kvetii]